MNQVVIDGHYELEVERSKFIADLIAVPSSRQADERLTAVREAHPGASHVVFALAVDEGPQPLRRSSDAGEPHGTAGRPVLAVIDGADLINALAIVIRYYGGKKLGTGGLARAYAAAARGALESASIRPLIPMVTLELAVPFALEDVVRRECESAGARILSVEYTSEVLLTVDLVAEKRGAFEQDITDGTAGNVRSREKSAPET